MTDLQSPFTFACPACQTKLQVISANVQRCPVDGNEYLCQDGVWRFLLPQRRDYFSQFVREYETVRQAEGRGSSDAAYYRALPFEDLSGRMATDWKIRARSYRSLVQRVVQPLEEKKKVPLKVLDLGAGNGWLSNRLAQRGHQVAAIDLLTNAQDGLGAFIYYKVAFTPLQAEFEALPFEAGEADLVVFNASFHYSVDYAVTLQEALRVLQPGGWVVILDSPVYRQADSGEQMVRERQARFRELYGFASNALPSRNYLTEQGLEDLASQVGLTWSRIIPYYGLRWALRPWAARLRGRREPARFLILVGERDSAAQGFTFKRSATITAR